MILGVYDLGGAWSWGCMILGCMILGVHGPGGCMVLGMYGPRGVWSWGALSRGCMVLGYDWGNGPRRQAGVCPGGTLLAGTTPPFPADGQTRVKTLPSSNLSSQVLFTVHKRSLRRLCFHKHLSFCPGGGGNLHSRVGRLPPPFGYYGLWSRPGGTNPTGMHSRLLGRFSYTWRKQLLCYVMSAVKTKLAPVENFTSHILLQVFV